MTRRMPLTRQLCIAIVLLATGSCYAETYVAPRPVVPIFPAPPVSLESWFGTLWNSLLFLLPTTVRTPATTSLEVEPAAASSPCVIERLPAIEDPEALAFENNVGSSAVVDTDGLTPGTARALARFRRIVSAFGGSITVTSAFRPAAYQQHLQTVWDKWMNELRDNQDPGCEQLKAQVQGEFTRHQLLETQRPVPFSDHTRGVGFDAALVLPKARRRITEDRLARLAGLRRPDIWRDPVHFRFTGTRT